MSTITHGNDADLAGFMAGWDGVWTSETVTATLGVIGLTNFGERPVPSRRLAGLLGRPVSEVEALVRQWSGGGCGGARVEDGLITYDPGRTRSAARRWFQVGDRLFGMTGCAPHAFAFAPLVRPSLRVEETCPATGTPVRILFAPDHVERVEPGGAVLALPRGQDVAEQMAAAGDADAIDANVCSQMPLFASAEAAGGWLAAHPGGRVFPVREAWDLNFIRDTRDRMSALLNLD